MTASFAKALTGTQAGVQQCNRGKSISTCRIQDAGYTYIPLPHRIPHTRHDE